MELFGLLFAFPITLFTSLVYVAIAFALFNFWPRIRSIALAASYVVAVLVIIEISLLVFLGAASTYHHLHQVYTALHFINFFLAPPAIANLVLRITTKNLFLKCIQFVGATIFCWAACMTVIFLNIGVDEAIMGVEAGKPFYMN